MSDEGCPGTRLWNEHWLGNNECVKFSEPTEVESVYTFSDAHPFTRRILSGELICRRGGTEIARYTLPGFPQPEPITELTLVSLGQQIQQKLISGEVDVYEQDCPFLDFVEASPSVSVTDFQYRLRPKLPDPTVRETI
jgi:hypothetical protein